MDGETSGLSELERAITRFETATARHRHQHQHAPVAVRRRTPSRPRWRHALAIAAAVLSTNLLAGVPSVRDGVGSAIEVRPLIAPPALVRQITLARRPGLREDAGPVLPFVGLAPPPVAEVPTMVKRPNVAVTGVPAPLGDADFIVWRPPVAPVDTAPAATAEDPPDAAAPDGRDAQPNDTTASVGVPFADLLCAVPEHGGVATAVATGDTPLVRSPLQPPAVIPYSGVMTTTSGTPRVGRVTTIFALYQTPDGGIPVWVDIKEVETSDTGAYIVRLGQPTPFPASLFTDGPAPWLGIQPDGQAELPRIRVMDRPCGRPAPVAPSPAVPSPPPPLIPYRGTLHDSGGGPVVGLVSAICAFYEEPTGGLPLWVDIRTVRAGAAGGYTMLLGSGTELPADLLTTGVPRWLSVQPDGHGEQIRVEFSAVSPGLH